MQITLQFSVPATILPKASVYVPPVGSPVITYVPIIISVYGLKAGDTLVSALTTTPDANKAQLISITDNQLAVKNTSTTVNETLSGNITITREVELFKSYSEMTDADGYVTVSHELYSTPTKWLATSEINNDLPITLNKVSSNSTTITLRAFVGTSPLANADINFSVLVG